MPNRAILQDGEDVTVEISSIQEKEAASLGRVRKVSFGDALHAVLARDNFAVMVTRDKHFLELMDIVEVRKPEDLLFQSF